MKTQLLALSLASAAFMASSLSARPEGPPPPPNPEEVVVDVFADYDTDESNTLNQDELVAALTGMREKQKGDRPRMGRKGSEDDATADRPEKSRKGDRRGPPAPEEIAPKLIEDFDVSGDGELDTEEMLAALKTMHGKGRRGGPRNAADDSE